MRIASFTFDSLLILISIYSITMFLASSWRLFTVLLCIGISLGLFLLKNKYVKRRFVPKFYAKRSLRGQKIIVATRMALLLGIVLGYSLTIVFATISTIMVGIGIWFGIMCLIFTLYHFKKWK